jgi:transcriptional regulator with XRE-family HTH domain
MRRASYKHRLQFAAEMMETAFFGAFYAAILARKEEQSLTRAALGKRMGREKTGISKLLSGPRNWQIDTISDLAEALDLRLEIALVDRVNPLRKFTPTGVVFNIPTEMTTGLSQLINAPSPELPLNPENLRAATSYQPISQAQVLSIFRLPHHGGYNQGLALTDQRASAIAPST